MPLGTARQVDSLHELLASADFITIHVPETPETKTMMGDKEFECMKKGSYFINASRGSVVQIPALVRALKRGQLAGAALDVYPKEPAKNGETFTSDLGDWVDELRECENVLMTPHIGLYEVATIWL